MNIEKAKTRLVSVLEHTGPVKWLLLILVMTVFTMILYPNTIIRRHDYSLGDVAERDIKAQRDFLVEDQAGTEKKRRQAAESVLTVYDYNTALLDTIRNNVDNAFSMMQEAGPDTVENTPAPEETNPADIAGKKRVFPGRFQPRSWAFYPGSSTTGWCRTKRC